MYAVGNYFNYFINLSPSRPDFWLDILQITLVYVVCIVFRSVVFAVANLR